MWNREILAGKAEYLQGKSAPKSLSKPKIDGRVLKNKNAVDPFFSILAVAIYPKIVGNEVLYIDAVSISGDPDSVKFVLDEDPSGPLEVSVATTDAYRIPSLLDLDADPLPLRTA
ncbi:hypothetical protein H0H81_002741 [Sphagnurus paluster]|uniref:Uncharacterized protein n=1 Tax=Sphagnurus paluster TaxID=117069 RepID=A0A9P7K2K0_9AGAR|nr:hypothetical protein H0H81_002741 [Sphagnurus paluster]